MTPSEPTVPHPKGLWRRALLAAFAAALVSWLGGEAAYRQFVAARDADLPARFRGNQGASAAYLKSSFKVDQARLASATYGMLGGALGLGLGLAGGLSGRVPGAAKRAAAVGLILGATVGAAVPRGVVPLYFRALDGISETEESGDVQWALATHATIWASVGLVGGLALSLGLGAGAGSAVGGALGGILAAVTYEIIGALAFSTSRSGLPVGETAMLRVLAQGFPALAVAVCATLGSARNSRKVVPRSN